MKVRLHFPREEFGFVEVEAETDSIDEAIELYDTSKRAYKATGEGIDTKTFNDALDRYLNEGTGETDVYLRMNEKQKEVFQEIKKSLKRIKPKE